MTYRNKALERAIIGGITTWALIGSCSPQAASQTLPTKIINPANPSEPKQPEKQSLLDITLQQSATARFLREQLTRQGWKIQAQYQDSTGLPPKTDEPPLLTNLTRSDHDKKIIQVIMPSDLPPIIAAREASLAAVWQMGQQYIQQRGLWASDTEMARWSPSQGLFHFVGQQALAINLSLNCLQELPPLDKLPLPTQPETATPGPSETFLNNLNQTIQGQHRQDDGKMMQLYAHLMEESLFVMRFQAMYKQQRQNTPNEVWEILPAIPPQSALKTLVVAHRKIQQDQLAWQKKQQETRLIPSPDRSFLPVSANVAGIPSHWRSASRY